MLVELLIIRFNTSEYKVKHLISFPVYEKLIKILRQECLWFGLWFHFHIQNEININLNERDSRTFNLHLHLYQIYNQLEECFSKIIYALSSYFKPTKQWAWNKIAFFLT